MRFGGGGWDSGSSWCVITTTPDLHGSTDWLESGETMKAAGLKAIDTVVDSTAVLIKSKHPSNPKLVGLIASRISGVISKSSFTVSKQTLNPARCPEIRALSIQR